MSSNDGAITRAAGSREAARRQRRIGWTLTLILAAVYLAYLLAVVLSPETMAAPVGGNFTTGLVGGAGVIFFALLLGFYYVAQANRNDIDNARRS